LVTNIGNTQRQESYHHIKGVSLIQLNPVITLYVTPKINIPLESFY
jgi:hypothetical protein